MIKMYKIKRFFWILPLIGGFLTLISIISPAAFYFSSSGHLFFWMWGWYDRIGIWDYGMAKSLISDPLILCIGTICTILIIIGANVVFGFILFF